MKGSKKTKKTCGVGSECSVLLDYVHPANRVAEVLPDRSTTDRLEGVIVIKRKEELHASKRYVRVEKEGSPKHLFVEAGKEEAAEGWRSGKK